jgi:hypothetical protein
MHFATFIVLFAAAAILGAPTESTFGTASLSSEVFDQGDGFYLASVNETGVFDVEFTSMAELMAQDPVEHLAAEDLTARDTPTLSKRYTRCSGRKSAALGTLDEANRQLARNAAGQGNYPAGKWGWVSLSSSTPNLSCDDK